MGNFGKESHMILKLTAISLSLSLSLSLSGWNLKIVFSGSLILRFVIFLIEDGVYTRQCFMVDGRGLVPEDALTTDLHSTTTLR